MPFLQKISLSPIAMLGIWQLNESVKELQAHFPNISTKKINTIGGERRQKEWLATRILLQKLLPDYTPQIHYEPLGRPLLSGSPYPFLSISHSRQLVAIYLHQQAKVGVDIEPIRPKIHKIKQRFLSAKELATINSDDTNTLILYWCAKEALYKLYGQKELEFKVNLRVKQAATISSFVDSPYLIGQIQKGHYFLETKIYYRKIEGHFLAYCAAPS